MTATSGKLMKGATGDWEVVIGMEIHAQVTSKSKLFSGASTAFGGDPNSHVSLVDAAMPGMLPVINEECVRQAVRTGLGLNAKINLRSVFDRKNYFYPDLPQGYQISQYKSPVVGEGEITIDSRDNTIVRVGIERIHLEQDAGKLLHDQDPNMSFVDLNRSGVALMEIVSKPDLRSFDDAMNFVAKLRLIMQYLGTCDGDMEKGHLRADVNVSVRRPGGPLGTRCEIKNMNSINFIGQAIEYEARRQIEIIEDGGVIEQETRLYDPNKGETRAMRSKEEAHDYRYFPDPDLMPLEITQAEVDAIRAALPELPDAKKERFLSLYSNDGVSLYDATLLVGNPEAADLFEQFIANGIPAKAAANWVINVSLPAGSAVVRKHLNEAIGPFSYVKPWIHVTGPTGPSANTQILVMTVAGELSSSMAKALHEEVSAIGPIDDPEAVKRIAEERGMKQVTDLGAIEKVVDEIIAANPDKVAQAKAKPQLAGWFVGQVMKSSGGKANPQAVNDLLKSKLGI
ncbi:Asp-tRNA(Asn)/Glu-tRNA(Gln) amidotransferase subunit GatB [Bradyrhizobium oligotrophicum]|uniref:Asp-tRNA(Asn)/Glu-tRNA(Gln) amidotransferase subunit GatB n=1 Tax=Bradyrhizobium oligotrophicum TaxID=44255 RepID=UPI003EBA15A9